MKRFLILFIIFTTASQAQQVKTQKDIMQLPNTDLVKDYNLKTKGTIKPVTVTKATYTDYGFGLVNKKFNYLKEDYSTQVLTFKDSRLTSRSSMFYNSFGKPNGFYFYYFYDEKGILKRMTSKSTNAGKLDESSEVNNYAFDTNGVIKETLYTGNKKTTTTKYNHKGNTISYSFANGKTTYHIKNVLIIKAVTFNKSANKTYTTSYNYTNNGFLNFEDGGSYKYTYLLNKNNLIEKEIGKSNTRHYKYVYDKYGNWIIGYHLSTSDKNYSGEKTKTHLYGSKFSFYVREIKYSNGDVTGSVNLEDTKTKNDILRIRTELYNSLIEASTSFMRTENNSYLFKINDQQEAKSTLSGFMNRSLLVFHKPTKQLFICEGYADKTTGKYFPAKKLSIDTKNGYWYRTPKGIIHVFKADGTYIEKFKVFKYATNDIDAILQENNDSSQILLENYKNSASYKVYPVKLYGSSLKPTVVKRKLQKELFDLPNTDLVEDYNLKIGKGNAIPKQIDEKQFDQRTKRGSKEIMTTLERTKAWYFDTENKRINSNSIIYRDQKTTIKYIYNSKGRLLMHNYSSPTFKYTDTFTYDDDGTFRYVKIYDGKSNSTRQTFKKTDYGYISSGLIFKKYYLKNNLVQKAIVNYNRSEPSEDTYEYNNYNRLAKSESSFATMNYAYNSSGDIETSIETSKNTNTITKRNYIYKYDKYGNWIISLSLLNLSYAKGISSFPNPKLRKITYSNGEVTGTTNIDEVKNELIFLRKKIRELDNSTAVKTATWKKTSKDNFHFYIGNKNVTNATNSFMGDHLLFFNKESSQLYILESFNSASINKNFNAIKTSIDTKHGYWYKKPSGGVVVFLGNGDYSKENILYALAPNKNDVFYQDKNQFNKVVLKNYKNAQINTVYPAIAFDAYDETATKTTKKNINSSGECIKGDCENGYGERKFSNGIIAEGFFENGRPYGVMHLNTPAKNESQLANFRGNYTTKVGMVYRYYGNRYTDMIDYGKQIGVSNDATKKQSYTINFKDGKVVSKTAMTNNGNNGCIAGNCTNGSGVYKYNNGAFYFGTFKNGKRHGFGKLDFKSGNAYIGEFSNDSYSGIGTYTWSKYNFYMGEYKDGTYHGKGIMYYNKDRYDAGVWKNGKFVGK